MTTGWARIYRQFTESDFWLSEKFTKPQAWIDLIVNANHKDGSFWIRGIEVKVKRGQLGWSELTMGKRWHWSRNKVRLFLKWLVKDEKIVQQKVQQITTIISLINYEKYQSEVQQNEQQMVQQKDNKRYTNKNDNNEKNEIYREIIDCFNEIPGRRSRKVDEKAVDYWSGLYTLEEIKTAIGKIPSDEFWKDKMDLTILFRRKNPQGEAVDYIGQLLNRKQKLIVKRFDTLEL